MSFSDEKDLLAVKIVSMANDSNVKFISIFNLQVLDGHHNLEHSRLQVLEIIADKIDPRELLDLKYLDLFAGRGYNFRCNAVKILRNKIINFYDHCEKIKAPDTLYSLLKHVGSKSNRVLVPLSYVHKIAYHIRVNIASPESIRKLESLMLKEYKININWSVLMSEERGDFRRMKDKEKEEIGELNKNYPFNPVIHEDVRKFLNEKMRNEALILIEDERRRFANFEGIPLSEVNILSRRSDSDAFISSDERNFTKKLENSKEDKTEEKNGTEKVGYESKICVICFDEERTTIFVPCCHNVTCDNCSGKLKTCPICRKDILQIIKPIVS